MRRASAVAGLARRSCTRHSPSVSPRAGVGHAHTPESPVVQAMLKRATDFLLKETVVAQGPGGEALVGLALFKAGLEPTHPRVQSAIAAARGFAQGAGRTGLGNSCYGAAMCCVLLCDVDPQSYHGEIGYLVAGFLRRQRSNGCWSYEPYSYDDTSQTQYGLLCLWSAAQNGHEIPVEAIERTATWLIATQHSDGGWSYRTHRAEGSETAGGEHWQTTHSMTAAGAGTLYVAAHLFGYGLPSDQNQDGLPPALKRVDEQARRGGVTLSAKDVNRTAMENAMKGGNGWFARNPANDVGWWTHYYMYGLERYRSFQELVEGSRVKEPDWYNRGVEYLKKTQAANGSWSSQGGAVRP